MSDIQHLSSALAERYAVDREIGAGGMATVFLARDLRHDRTVAIKVLGDEQAALLGSERFTREIKLLARLRHPFVLPLYDSGSADGVLYFVMPYIDGESLRARLARGGPTSVEQALSVLHQVADALDYAHAEGVVHRDVKPENILLSRHGHALLADFGIARQDTPAPDSSTLLTQVGVAVGTVTYMSPYERQLEDVFAVQDDITARIVETVTHALQLGGLRGGANVRQPRSLEAYDLYLLGRHHWYKRTEDSMRRALQLFEQAAAVDPDYAPAHSGIADASALLASWQFAAPDEMYPRAVRAAHRALALDPGSADAHASLGFVHMNWDWDWEATVRELRAAIALNPNHETAHRWLSAFLAGVGRFDEAIPLAERVLRFDPVSVLPHMNLGIVLYFANRTSEAADAFRRALEIDPTFVRAHAFLGATLDIAGRRDEAIECWRSAVELSGQHSTMLVLLAGTLARAGRLDEAQATFELTRDKPLQPIYAAMWPAAKGDADQMMDVLERGFADRSDWMYTIGVQPWFRPYHAHPRFRALLQRMKLDLFEYSTD